MKRKSIILLENWKHLHKGTAVSPNEAEADKLIADGKAEELKGRYLEPEKARKPAKKSPKKAKKPPEKAQ